jgi:hypothetical protein
VVADILGNSRAIVESVYAHTDEAQRNAAIEGYEAWLTGRELAESAKEAGM